MNMKNANAQAKLINMGTNLSALAVFLIDGSALIPLGVAAGLCNMLGSRIGSGLVLTKGGQIIKPAVVIFLILLTLKVVGVY